MGLYEQWTVNSAEMQKRIAAQVQRETDTYSELDLTDFDREFLAGCKVKP